MNVLIVGGGGREHAIAWALSKSEQVEQLYCAPGNGGIAALAQCIPLRHRRGWSGGLGPDPFH